MAEESSQSAGGRFRLRKKKSAQGSDTPIAI